MTTLIVLRLPSLNFPHKFQLDFSPKAFLLFLSTEHKISMEKAVELVNKLNGHYPFLSGRLELGYPWLDAVNILLHVNLP